MSATLEMKVETFQSLADSSKALTVWLEQGRAISEADNQRQFAVGDWLASGDEKWGRKAYDEAGAIFRGYSRATLKTFCQVSRRVPVQLRNRSLSWAHHKAVARFEKPDLQEQLLAHALERNMAVSVFRRYIEDKYPPVKPAVALPRGTYRIVYADPPWQYPEGCPENYGPADRHYPSMATDDICNLQLPKVASDAVLFLWATVPLLREAFKVLDAWGFQYKSNFVWDKVRHNFSNYLSIRHEMLLIATRGSSTPDGVHIDEGGVKRKHLLDSVQSIERTEHSRKPAEFRAMIDKMYTRGQRVELFARGTLPLGWDGYGNEYKEREAECELAEAA
jgi:N6-adenosine-specific RNA methylase IME4